MPSPLYTFRSPFWLSSKEETLVVKSCMDTNVLSVCQVEERSKLNHQSSPALQHKVANRISDPSLPPRSESFSSGGIQQARTPPMHRLVEPQVLPDLSLERHMCCEEHWPQTSPFRWRTWSLWSPMALPWQDPSRCMISPLRASQPSKRVCHLTDHRCLGRTLTPHQKPPPHHLALPTEMRSLNVALGWDRKMTSLQRW